MTFNKFPAVDENNKFPPVIRQAMALYTELVAAFASKATETDYNAHAANRNNPHAVTKAQVGLGNVDNTSDMNKPVSTIQKAGLTPRWVSGTVYAIGDQVTTPNNTVMTANVAHTANALFATDIAKWDGQNSGVPFAHMGRTQGFQGLTATAAVCVMATAQEMRGGFTFDAASNCLVVPVTGRYRVHLKGYYSGGASASNTTGLWFNGASVGAATPQLQTLQSVAQKDGSGTDIQEHAYGLSVPFTAGDKVGLSLASAVSAWGTNGYNGSFIELEYVGI